MNAGEVPLLAAPPVLRYMADLAIDARRQQRANLRRKRKLAAIRAENKRLKRLMRRMLPYVNPSMCELRRELREACCCSYTVDSKVIITHEYAEHTESEEWRKACSRD